MFGCRSEDIGFHLFGIRTFYRPLVCQGVSRGLQGEGSLKGVEGGTNKLEGGLKVQTFKGVSRVLQRGFNGVSR